MSSTADAADYSNNLYCSRGVLTAGLNFSAAIPSAEKKDRRGRQRHSEMPSRLRRETSPTMLAL